MIVIKYSIQIDKLLGSDIASIYIKCVDVIWGKLTFKTF